MAAQEKGSVIRSALTRDVRRNLTAGPRQIVSKLDSYGLRPESKACAQNQIDLCSAAVLLLPKA